MRTAAYAASRGSSDVPGKPSVSGNRFQCRRLSWICRRSHCPAKSGAAQTTPSTCSGRRRTRQGRRTESSSRISCEGCLAAAGRDLPNLYLSALSEIILRNLAAATIPARPSTPKEFRDEQRGFTRMTGLSPAALREILLVHMDTLEVPFVDTILRSGLRFWSPAYSRRKGAFPRPWRFLCRNSVSQHVDENHQVYAVVSVNIKRRCSKTTWSLRRCPWPGGSACALNRPGGHSVVVHRTSNQKTAAAHRRSWPKRPGNAVAFSPDPRIETACE